MKRKDWVGEIINKELDRDYGMDWDYLGSFNTFCN